MATTVDCHEGRHDVCRGRGSDALIPQTADDGDQWCNCGCHRVDSAVDTMKHIATVQGFILAAVSDLLQRAQVHDASKMEEPEKPLFDLWSPRLRQMEFGTPEYEEARASMGVALTHHYEVNDHHPEHFPNGIEDMDLLQLVEMLCDWKAAGLRHGEHGITLEESIERNAERFGYDERFARMLVRTADRLGWL